MAQTGNPPAPLRDTAALAADAVDRALKAAIPGLSGAPVVRQYESGASNLTFAIDYPERRLVLRRPPTGTLPKAGHDMHREYRVITALRPVFPKVPETLFYSDDMSITGAEFYVMERVEGHLLHKTIPAQWGWSAGCTRELCENFWSTLVALHAVDYEAIGLGDFGRPEGYVDRQIAGWNRRFEKALTEDVEPFEDVKRWLEDNKPEPEMGARASLLHGDYRIDNCILNLGKPTQIDAILDWEICALGEPLMDLGNALAYWVEPGDAEDLKAFAMQPSMEPGMMSRREVLEFYGEQTGRSIGDFHFYFVYGVWRLAVIFQQIYYRSYHGESDNPRFKTFGAVARMFGRTAREKIHLGTL